MSFKVVNRIDRDFRWDNGSNPYGFNIPFPTTGDNGKVLSVVEGNYALAADASGEETIYFNLRLNTSDSILTVTDTEYTVLEINNMVYSYITPIVLRVQYDETDVYRLFNLYRIEETEHVTKWCSTVSTDNSGVEIYNDLININDNGTLTFYRREVKNLIAGDNIQISNNVISAVLPTKTKDLLWAETNLVITDGWTNIGYGIQPAHDIFTYYDEIVIELAPVQNMSAGNDALSKGGMYIDATHSVNKHIIGRKTVVDSTYPVYPDNPFVFNNLSIYSPTIGDPNTKVNYNLTFYIDKDSDNYYFLHGICNASSITATLWANCAYYCYGIKY